MNTVGNKCGEVCRQCSKTPKGETQDPKILLSKDRTGMQNYASLILLCFQSFLKLDSVRTKPYRPWMVCLLFHWFKSVSLSFAWHNFFVLNKLSIFYFASTSYWDKRSHQYLPMCLLIIKTTLLSSSRHLTLTRTTKHLNLYRTQLYDHDRLILLSLLPSRQGNIGPQS